MQGRAQLHKAGENVIPVENAWSYITSLPNNLDLKNVYFKDVNHVLERYKGLWTGTYQNKNYVFAVYLTLRHHDKTWDNVYSDLLLIRYKITDASGKVLVNTMDDTPGSPYILFGLRFTKDHKKYRVSYIGKNSRCGNEGFIILSMIADNKINLNILPGYGGLIDLDDCPNGIIKPPFPGQEEAPMVLTKIGPAPNPPGGGLQLNPKYQ